MHLPDTAKKRAQPSIGCARFLHIIQNNVREGLAAYRDIIPLAVHHNDGETRIAVIVGCHRIVISARRQHRDEIAAGQTARERNLLLQDVAALAAATRQVAEHIAGLIHLIRRDDGVRRLIQRIAGIIPHPAVDTHIGLVAGDGLDRANGVQRDKVTTDQDTSDTGTVTNRHTGTVNTTDTGTVTTTDDYHIEGDSAIRDAQDIMRLETQERLANDLIDIIIEDFKKRFCLMVY